MDLLYVRHPDPLLHKRQLELLDALPEAEKPEYARMLRFGNAAMHYYDSEAQPTEDDYNDWLSGLPENIRASMRKKGYKDCKSVLGLQRHALERRDVGMSEFIRGLLNEEDFELWQKSGE